MSVRKNFVSFENFYTGFIQFSQNIGESFTQSVFFQISESCARRNKRLPSRLFRPTISLLRLLEKSLSPALTFFMPISEKRAFSFLIFFLSRVEIRAVAYHPADKIFLSHGGEDEKVCPSPPRKGIEERIFQKQP